MPNITINGKSPEEVFAELRKEFPEDAIARDHKNNLYVKMSAVEERLNEVLGLNFSTHILCSKTETIGSVPYFLFDCKITVRDDNGDIVCERSGAGGSQVRLHTKGERIGLPVDAAEDYKAAVQTAFKKAARSLGVAAYLKEEGPNPSEEKEKSKKTGGSSGPAPNTNPEKLKFKVLAKPNALSQCIKVDACTDDGERGELVLWKREADTMDPKVVDAFKGLAPGHMLCCEVIRGIYRNTAQFSIKKFVKAS